jgi:hypothetical protein
MVGVSFAQRHTEYVGCFEAASGPAREKVSPFAPRKDAAFAERKATIRQLLITGPLFDLGQPQIGLARIERLRRAIHQQIEFFEDNGPDQGVISARFDHGGEDCVAAEQLEPNIVDDLPFLAPIVGVSNHRLAVDLQISTRFTTSRLLARITSTENRPISAVFRTIDLLAKASEE